MAAEPGADLTGFVEAAGRSLADAQGALAGELVDVPTAVAISEAELEVKATVGNAAGGGVLLQPVSSETARQGGITPGLLSTIRIRYVAVVEDTLVPPSERPTRTPDKVIDDVKGREDVAALDKILGGLAYEATFVPHTRRWLVTARDSDARLVREVVVADEKR
ncbi:MAG: hypothetical protein ACRDN6_12450 [Gaiellaceae bacterium]